MQQTEVSCQDMAADIHMDLFLKLPPSSRAGSSRGGAWGSFVGSFWMKEGGNNWTDDTHSTSSTASRTCLLHVELSGVAAAVKGIEALVMSISSSKVSTNASNGGGGGAKAEELKMDQWMLKFELNLARLLPQQMLPDNF
jgi:hypothetical protein